MKHSLLGAEKEDSKTLTIWYRKEGLERTIKSEITLSMGIQLCSKAMSATVEETMLR